jgi:hypothetical protein
MHPVATEFTEDQQRVLKEVISASGGLSIIGTTFVIISYLVFKEFKFFHMRMILYLALCDYFGAISVCAEHLHLHQTDPSTALHTVHPWHSLSNHEPTRICAVLLLCFSGKPAFRITLLHFISTASTDGSFPGFHPIL